MSGLETEQDLTVKIIPSEKKAQGDKGCDDTEQVLLRGSGDFASTSINIP